MKRTILVSLTFGFILNCTPGHKGKDYFPMKWGNVWNYESETKSIVVDFGTDIENKQKEWLEAIIRASSGGTIPFRVSYRGEDVVVMLPYDFNTKDLMPVSFATILKSPVSIGRRFKVMETDSGPVYGEYVSTFSWSGRLDFPEEVGVRYYGIPTKMSMDTVEIIYRFNKEPSAVRVRYQNTEEIYRIVQR